MNTTTDQWYYSIDNQQQAGPVSSAALLAMLEAGSIHRQTLVWRDGMAQWQAFDTVADALGAAPAAPESRDVAVASAAQAEPLSPYAAPQSDVDSAGVVLAGGAVVYAGFWKRVAASIIDSLVTGAVSWMVQIPLFLLAGAGSAIFGGSSYGSEMSPVGVTMMVLAYALGFLVPLVYMSWMHSSPSQATLGKMAVGIKVTRLTGERISFWRAFGRYFGYILSSLTLCIGFVLAAFTERKQALHDFISDTLVVDKWAFTEHPEWQKPELGVVTIVVLSLAGLLLLAALIAMMMAAALIFSAFS